MKNILTITVLCTLFILGTLGGLYLAFTNSMISQEDTPPAIEDTTIEEINESEDAPALENNITEEEKVTDVEEVIDIEEEVTDVEEEVTDVEEEVTDVEEVIDIGEEEVTEEAPVSEDYILDRMAGYRGLKAVPPEVTDPEILAFFNRTRWVYPLNEDIVFTFDNGEVVYYKKHTHYKGTYRLVEDSGVYILMMFLREYDRNGMYEQHSFPVVYEVIFSEDMHKLIFTNQDRSTFALVFDGLIW